MQSTYEDPCVPSRTDIVFIANAYRFIIDRDIFLNNLFKQTRQDTQFVFVDFKGNNARVSPSMVISEVKEAGFEVVDFDTEGCPDHYILTFKKVVV